MIHYLKEIYDKFPVYQNESLIMGSTVLYILNIIKEFPGDIDIVLTGKSWRLMDKRYGYTPSLLDGKKINYQPIDVNMPYEFYDIIGHDFKFTQCFKDSIKIDGFHFMNPIDVMEWNYRMGREKDLMRNKSIEKYLRGKGS